MDPMEYDRVGKVYFSSSWLAHSRKAKINLCMAIFWSKWWLYLKKWFILKQTSVYRFVNSSLCEGSHDVGINWFNLILAIFNTVLSWRFKQTWSFRLCCECIVCFLISNYQFHMVWIEWISKRITELLPCIPEWRN